MLKRLLLPLAATFATYALPTQPDNVHADLQREIDAIKNFTYVITPETGDELIDYLQPGQKAALLVFCQDSMKLCRELEPALDRLAKNRRGVLNVVKVDTKKFNALRQFWKVDKAPTVILFRDGMFLGQEVGVMTPKELRDWVDEKMDKKPAVKAPAP